MKIEQIYTSCLSQGAYYIESNGEVAIIDPLRETQQYVDKATADNATIKFIFETHIHADFVSGHVDLAKKTGATIVYGPNANTLFDCYNASDNEEFKIGNITLKALHTPGHTLESVTYLLIDEKGKNHAIFTGDTLFLGDVGRPDLAIKSDLSEKDLVINDNSYVVGVISQVRQDRSIVSTILNPSFSIEGIDKYGNEYLITSDSKNLYVNSTNLKEENTDIKYIYTDITFGHPGQFPIIDLSSTSINIANNKITAEQEIDFNINYFSNIYLLKTK